MKILFEPEREERHDCAKGLYDLGDKPIGTKVACLCGLRWVAVRDSFWSFMTGQLIRTRPMWTKPHSRVDKRWRCYGHVTADWSDVPGEEVGS